jgi:hypothetical protein
MGLPSLGEGVRAGLRSVILLGAIIVTRAWRECRASNFHQLNAHARVFQHFLMYYG